MLGRVESLHFHEHPYFSAENIQCLPESRDWLSVGEHALPHRIERRSRDVDTGDRIVVMNDKRSIRGGVDVQLHSV